MTVSRQLFVMALSLCLLGSATSAWAQSRSATAGGGVEPRYLKPCGRVISITDLGDEPGCGCAAPRDCATPGGCAAPPTCAAAPVEPSCGTAEPCAACRLRSAAPLRTAWNRFLEPFLPSPSCKCACTCREPCRIARPSCSAPPSCGCEAPALPVGGAPVAPRVDADPFRDDSVQSNPPAKEASLPARRPALTGQPTLAPPQPATMPASSDAGGGRVALNAPRLLADQ
jgi:hypothetical protein